MTGVAGWTEQYFWRTGGWEEKWANIFSVAFSSPFSGDGVVLTIAYQPFPRRQWLSNYLHTLIITTLNPFAMRKDEIARHIFESITTSRSARYHNRSQANIRPTDTDHASKTPLNVFERSGVVYEINFETNYMGKMGKVARLHEPPCAFSRHEERSKIWMYIVEAEHHGYCSWHEQRFPSDEWNLVHRKQLIRSTYWSTVVLSSFDKSNRSRQASSKYDKK